MVPHIIIRSPRPQIEEFASEEGCVSAPDVRWPITRAMMSFGPPGGNSSRHITIASWREILMEPSSPYVL
jgi:hypothetical protein